MWQYSVKPYSINDNTQHLCLNCTNKKPVIPDKGDRKKL